MNDTFRIAFAGAIGAIVWEVIRAGFLGIDWVSPFVVGVVTTLSYSAIATLTKKEPEPD